VSPCSRYPGLRRPRRARLRFSSSCCRAARNSTASTIAGTGTKTQSLGSAATGHCCATVPPAGRGLPAVGPSSLAASCASFRRRLDLDTPGFGECATRLCGTGCRRLQRFEEQLELPPLLVDGGAVDNVIRLVRNTNSRCCLHPRNPPAGRNTPCLRAPVGRRRSLGPAALPCVAPAPFFHDPVIRGVFHKIRVLPSQSAKPQVICLSTIADQHRGAQIEVFDVERFVSVSRTREKTTPLGMPWPYRSLRANDVLISASRDTMGRVRW
jgi:hypothetical protein